MIGSIGCLIMFCLLLMILKICFADELGLEAVVLYERFAEADYLFQQFSIASLLQSFLAELGHLLFSGSLESGVK